MREPADSDIEVVYVRAKPRKLKNVLAFPDDDLRHCWYPPRGLPNWKEGAFYLSKVALTHPNGTVVPPNTPFVVSELTEGKLMATGDSLNDPIVPGGDYLALTAINPETGAPITFGFWHGVQEDQSRNFELVENEMTIIAIASTGLDYSPASSAP